MFVVVILLILVILTILAMRGRHGHPGLAALKGWSYAHRGLHDDTLPENSMGAFRAALEHGYGIELDVHLLKDGSLAVLHDSNLKRITGQDGMIEDLTKEDLQNYHLGGTEFTIPLFSQVLELFDGKAPLIVEIKTSGKNAVAVTEATCKLLDSYNGPFCLESFDPRSIYWLKKHRPEMIRGQLPENYLASKPKTVKKLMWFVMRHQLLNFLTLPDFVAYEFFGRKTISNFIVRKLWGVQGVSWTIRTPEDYRTACQEGWLPIFEKFIP